MTLAFRLLPLCLLPLCVSACVVPIGGAEVGDLRVTWSFDGSQRCAEVGVDNVIVQLIEEGKEGEGARAFGLTAECITGSMVIPDVVAGKYTMTAVGEGEVAVFNNGRGAVVEVIANDEAEVEAPLKLANGEVVSRIEFQYRFEDEALCSVAGVTTIRAQVIDENGIGIAGSDTDCVAGLAAVEGIRIGSHTLLVEALDGDGNTLFVSPPERRSLTGLQAGETLRLDPLNLTAAVVDATVRYTFGGVRFCAQAGVANVEAQLIDSATDDVIDGQNIDCVTGRIEFLNVPAGTYDLHLDGVDENGEVQFTKDVRDIAFAGATKDLGVIDLVALSSQVEVRFSLPDNESCASLGITNVDVRIRAQNGASTGATALCIEGQVTLAGPAPGAATISIEAQVGLDIVLTASRQLNLAPGENVVPLALTPIRTVLDASWSFKLVEVNDVAVVVDLLDTRTTETRTTSCRDVGVDNVLVTVSRGNTLLDAVVTTCDERRVEIPALPLAGGSVTVKYEGLRELEGDSIFEVTRTVILGGPRTTDIAELVPSIVFARVVWNGDCGAASAATVDVQVKANGVTEAGINVACAQGTTVIAMPRGTERSTVDISLRGVDGQGAPRPDAETVSADADNPVVPGINTFRFGGPQ
jgi:hypothetical protein